jgi:hypothetical protein
MRHRNGRRPPPAAQRSAALIRANRDRLQRAELIAGFVQRVAAMRQPTAPRIARLAKILLASLPDGDLDPQRAVTAAHAVQEMDSRWRALSIGDELTVDWPARLRMTATPLVPDTRRRHGAPVRRKRAPASRRTG